MSRTTKSKKSGGLSRLLNKLWKSHGKKAVAQHGPKAIEQYGPRAVAGVQGRLEQSDNPHSRRGAEMVGRYGDDGVRLASNYLAQSQRSQQYPPAGAPGYGYGAPATARPPRPYR